MASGTAAELKEAGIIEDVIDGMDEPHGIQMEIDFGGHKVKNGELLSPQQAAAKPNVVLAGGAEGIYYTLVATDPDAPDPKAPTNAEWLHWLVVNIASKKVDLGHEVLPWM
jgi:phosphatidylethanolamine-binding protein